MGLSPRLHVPLLAAAGLVVAAAFLLPFRAVTFARADGATVRMPAPERLYHHSDAWDYLQLGRRLWQGDGFTSRFTYVPFLPESVPAGGGRADAFPLLWRQPGFPLLVAAAFTLAGGPDPNAYLALQALTLVLLPLAAYFLGRSVLSPGWAATASVWALLSPVVVGVDEPIIATTFYAVWVTLLFAVMLRARGGLGALGAGMLVGVGALLRQETWVLLPGLMLAYVLAGERRRKRDLVILAAASVLVALPWNLRIWRITGAPLYNTGSLLYHATRSFPDWTASRTLAVRGLHPWSFLLAHPGELLGKGALDLLRYLRDLALMPSLFLTPFLALVVLRPPRERRARALVWGGLLATGLLVLVLAPMEYSRRFLGPLIPGLAVAAAIALSRFPRRRALLGGAAVVVGLATLAAAMHARRPDGSSARVAAELNRLLSDPGIASRIDGATVISDAPTLYAWIWDRPAVVWPVPEDLPRVRSLVGPSLGLFTCYAGPRDAFASATVAALAAQGGREVLGPCPVAVVWDRPADPNPSSRPGAPGPGQEPPR